MLGKCPDYHLFFTKRGGEEIVGSSHFEALYYSRVLDAISSANVVATPKTRGEKDVLRDLNPWEHEVAIVRGSKVVWQGPISDELNYSFSDNQHKVVIPCQDIMTWFNYRRVHITEDFVGEDIGVIYKTLVDDAMSRDPSPNINVDIAKTGVYTDRSYEESRRQITWNALDSLHATGIDATTVGREIWVGAQEVPVDKIGVLPKDTYRGLNVRKRGTDMGNDVSVTGSGSFGGSVTYGNYSSLVYDPANIEQFGLLESQTANFTLQTVAAAEAAAKTRWEFTKKPAIYAQMTLKTNAPVTFDQLVPGVLVELYDDDNLIELKGEYRMSRLDCQVVAGSEGSIAEAVTPIWTVAGTFSEAV